MKGFTWCEQNGVTPVTELERGMDFRLPEHRREVFLRSYAHHLKYGTLPGLVYMYFPYMAKKLNWTMEDKLWFAYVNGVTQNACTTLLITTQFPDVNTLDLEEFKEWNDANWRWLPFDLDRRHARWKLYDCVKDYKEHLGHQTQEEYFMSICSTDDVLENFRQLWDVVFKGNKNQGQKKFHMFGRLSAFSYLEYLKIMGLPIDCDSLFIDDIKGCMSPRNGLCKVLGRDDLYWHHTNPAMTGYSDEQIEHLIVEGASLLAEAKERFRDEPWASDIGYFTLESQLCTTKSWWRVNRRYPNVYCDMSYGRIKKCERLFKERGIDVSMDIFWQARQDMLPVDLRMEDNPNDPGEAAAKQNYFRETGDIHTLGIDDPAFRGVFHVDERRDQVIGETVGLFPKS